MEDGPLYPQQFDKTALISFNRNRCSNNADRLYHFDCDTCTYGELVYLGIENYVEEQVSLETKDKQIPIASSSNPLMNISLVNDKQKKEAEESIRNHLNINTLNGNRNINSKYPNVTGKIKRILIAYEKLIEDQMFFEDEIKSTDSVSLLISTKKQYQFHSGTLKAIDKTSDGKYTAIGSNDKKIKIIDGNSLESINTFNEHKGGITALCFSPSNKTLASGSWDRSIIIWDYKNGRSITKIKTDKEQVSVMKFINENTLIGGTKSGNIIICDFKNGSFNFPFKTNLICVLLLREHTQLDKSI